jgi:hypothetical protein
MIYTNAHGQTGPDFPSFTGDPPGPGTPDVIRFAKAYDPLVLETQVNTIGQQEAAAGRYLMGIQLGGASKGQQFVVQMLFDGIGTTPGMLFALDGGDGLRAFCFWGESVEAVLRNKDAAVRRALEFIGSDAIHTYRGFEISGSNDCLTFMGLMLVYREDAQI